PRTATRPPESWPPTGSGGPDAWNRRFRSCSCVSPSRRGLHGGEIFGVARTVIRFEIAPEGNGTIADDRLVAAARDDEPLVPFGRVDLRMVEPVEVQVGARCLARLAGRDDHARA